jgi:hypothetical protein
MIAIHRCCNSQAPPVWNCPFYYKAVYRPGSDKTRDYYGHIKPEGLLRLPYLRLRKTLFASHPTAAQRLRGKGTGGRGLGRGRQLPIPFCQWNFSLVIPSRNKLLRASVVPDATPASAVSGRG